jgi:hypothetical protein
MHQSSLLFGFTIVVVIWLCRRCLILLNLFNWIIDWMDDWSIFVDVCGLLNCWAGSWNNQRDFFILLFNVVGALLCEVDHLPLEIRTSILDKFPQE